MRLFQRNLLESLRQRQPRREQAVGFDQPQPTWVCNTVPVRNARYCPPARVRMPAADDGKRPGPGTAVRVEQMRRVDLEEAVGLGCNIFGNACLQNCTVLAEEQPAGLLWRCCRTRRTDALGCRRREQRGG